jgi:hypothetical protein
VIALLASLGAAGCDDAGDYTGWMNGDDTGTWSMTVAENCSILGSGRSDKDGPFDIVGVMERDIVLSATTWQGATWGGTIEDGLVDDELIKVVRGSWRQAELSGRIGGF